MKIIIKIFSIVVVTLIINACVPVPNLPIPNNPPNKYTLDSITVFKIDGQNNIYITTFIKGDSVNYIYTENNGIKNYTIYDRFPIYGSNYLGYVKASFKDNYLQLFNTLDISNNGSVYDSLILYRKSNDNIDYIKKITKSEDPLNTGQLSANRNFIYSNNELLNEINVSNPIKSPINFKDYYSTVQSYKFEYNIDYPNQYQLIDFDISNFILAASIIDFNVYQDYKVDFQRLLFLNNYRISPPLPYLPLKITYTYFNIINGSSVNISYQKNTQKDNRIESFTIGNYKYQIHYKP